MYHKVPAQNSTEYALPVYLRCINDLCWKWLPPCTPQNDPDTPNFLKWQLEFLGTLDIALNAIQQIFLCTWFLHACALLNLPNKCTGKTKWQLYFNESEVQKHLWTEVILVHMKNPGGRNLFGAHHFSVDNGSLFLIWLMHMKSFQLFRQLLIVDGF